MQGRAVPRRSWVAGPKVLGVLVGLLATFSMCAPIAKAVVVSSPAGRLSYLPLSEGAAAQFARPTPGGAETRSASPTGQPPLLYHGGPVMHSQAAYAIFWAPSGYAFPSGYRAAIEAFL